MRDNNICCSRVCAAGAVLLVLGCARQASAQLPIRYDLDGTAWIVNPETGKSAALRPEAILSPRRDLGNSPLAQRDSTYEDLIVEHARLNNVRPGLIRAVVSVESDFNPYAQSPKGALGLMQLMPATARQFNVTNPFDPEQNIRAGSSYLRQLLDRYDGNEELALAAYNAGPGAVDKYGQSIPPYRETQHYVTKVSEMAGEGEEVRKAGTRIYKLVQMIGGREITTYTTTKPQ